MSDTVHRDSVSSKSFRSSKELLDYCNKIEAGWFRCQAIAIGAAKLDAEQSQIACRHAIEAAMTERDAYRRQAPQVWVVRALVASGHRQSADQLVAQLIQGSDQIVPSNSQASMLELLFNHYESSDRKHHREIFHKLVELLESKGGWRVGRACAHAADALDKLGDSDLVDECVKKTTNSWLAGRIRRDRERSAK